MLILFDIDETLVDHHSAFEAGTRALYTSQDFGMPHAEFVAKWSAAHRRSFDRYLRGELTYAEQRRERVRDALGASLADAEADRLFDVYLAVYEASWQLFGDVLGCLDALADHRLGVVSNGQSRQQRAKLARLGIADRFEHVVISEECAWAKPAPEIFLHACRVVGESPATALHVGDSYDLDASAARQAGLTGVWLDRQGAATPMHAAPWITTLAQLRGLVDRGGE